MKKNITIGHEGRIEGKLYCDRAVILGTFAGELHCRVVEIRKGAHVRADIWHQLISMEAGADVIGHFQRQAAEKHAKQPSAEAVSSSVENR